MEEINIAELLKDCPKDMELYSPVFGQCKFKRVYSRDKICCIEIISGTSILNLNKIGQYLYSTNGECLLFPSKENRDWSKFVPPCKFKVGDRIRHKTHTRQGNIVTEIKDTHYILDYELALPFISQDDYELVPNKFDINTLKPFDKVLVRDSNFNSWQCAFYSHYVGNIYCFKTCSEKSYTQCIPYERNEHLLGTADDCDEYYKNWN